MDKVTRQCPQTTTFLMRKESRSGIEPTSFRFQPNALPLGQTGSRKFCEADSYKSPSFGWDYKPRSPVCIYPHAKRSHMHVKDHIVYAVSDFGLLHLLPYIVQHQHYEDWPLQRVRGYFGVSIIQCANLYGNVTPARTDQQWTMDNFHQMVKVMRKWTDSMELFSTAY